ncbi:allophanate hydrolase [Vibrio ponticus]|uniref:Allophanate hydrolase n=1 Tax=Vibrio ponticus TaxID=265668 RepID=A0ABX3F787_9VIBR|nr:allophanate hydrolase subunit 1 [Vibrio ponticus]OLQ84918.1 allophanate hydrolase [Vibrio ponticus]
MSIDITVNPVSECALIVEFKAADESLLPMIIGEFTEEFYRQYHPVIMNITPAVNTILIDYLPHRVTLAHLSELITDCFQEIDIEQLGLSRGGLIKLPVYYNNEVAPDIERYERNGISLAQLIELHTGQVYTVQSIGFAPGFAFMGDVNEQLRSPRLETPRLSVPKGSVGIAESRTAVYPNQSPGGWNIIGNCPMELYSPENVPMMPYKVGSRIQFYAIDRNEYIQLGGSIQGVFE